MAKVETDFATPIISAAAQVAKAVNAQALFAYFDAVADPGALATAVKAPTELVLFCREDSHVKEAHKLGIKSMLVPALTLSRMGQIKMATILAFSTGLLKERDAFVFLTGMAEHGIDTLMSMRVGEEYELFQSVGQPRLTEHIRRAVFEKALTLCLELGNEGREGKPVGAIFVIGDHRDVQKYCREGRINPFKGYTEKDRNILDESIRETVKEIAKMDGAFVLKGNGVILSGGTILQPASSPESIPQGLGARHAAAAAITATTKSIAITLSESTGTVRVWRRGTMITEIEKAMRPSGGPAAPPLAG